MEEGPKTLSYRELYMVRLLYPSAISDTPRPGATERAGRDERSETRAQPPKNSYTEEQRARLAALFKAH